MAELDQITEWVGIGPQKVLEDAPSGVVAVRADGNIAYANRAVVTLTGYSRGELIGRPIDCLLPEERRPGHSDYVLGWFKHPHPRPMGEGHLNIQGRNKQGELIDLDIQLSPIETDKGIMALAWIRERT